MPASKLPAGWITLTLTDGRAIGLQALSITASHRATSGTTTLVSTNFHDYYVVETVDVINGLVATALGSMPLILTV